MNWEFNGRVVGYNARWQEPAITEKHAYERILGCRQKLLEGYLYFGFPWASLIDGINRGTQLGRVLEAALYGINFSQAPFKVATVCQHIRFREFLGRMRDLGVTDVFASHAVEGEKEFDGVRIHPFPLYPVADLDALGEDRFTWGSFANRSLLYSFVGAYDPRYYLTKTRDWLRALPASEPSLLSVRREWHFEKRVYVEQVQGGAREQEDLVREQIAHKDYINVLLQSKFSLCPSGTGPNSIRLWESIDAGCIPVILADNLALPGNRSRWEEACVIIKEELEAVLDLPRQLASLASDSDKISEKLAKLREIRDRYGKDAFVTDLLEDKRKVVSRRMERLPRRASSKRAITLRFGKQSELEQFAWVLYVSQVIGSARTEHQIFLDPRGLCSSMRNAVEAKLFRRVCPGLDLGLRQQHLDENEQFAFVSGSEVLSAKLLSFFDLVHVQVTSELKWMDCRVYWQGIAEGWLHRLSCSLADELGAELAQQVLLKLSGMKPKVPLVSLLTSIFNGDLYLAEFLLNSSQMRGYKLCEHWLVRAASKGNEHSSLVSHVLAWSSAIYINLTHDPGLYEVWNLAARLARGRYLSNANLDDRRAPNHLVRLTDVLEKRDTVSVASSALRVTEKKNHRWEQSDDCVQWYSGQDLEYSAAQLVRANDDGHWSSHNMPHCMPIWRRELHAFYGFFEEDQYGPSADWEFWLRCASQGVRFYLVGEALGLYLRTEGSYWRRDKRASSYDERIIKKYVCGVDGVDAPEALASKFDRIGRMEAAGLGVESLVQLFCCAVQVIDEGMPVAARRLLDHVAQRLIGCPHFTEWAVRRSECIKAGTRSVDALLACALQLARKVCSLKRSEAEKKLPHVLEWGLLDLYSLTGDKRAVVGLALAYRRLGCEGREAALLRALLKKEGPEFWSLVQNVYLFDVSLPDLVQTAGMGVAKNRSAELISEPTHLRFYPDYRHGNAYQSLLYQNAIRAGMSVSGLNSVEEIRQLKAMESGRNILHIHWINAAIKGAGAAEFRERADAFLGSIKRAKARGFEIHWTVHNYQNHESVNLKSELKLRRALARLCDRVYVHHPMVIEQLDWLPPDVNVWLVEHGCYDVGAKIADRGEVARERLGFTKEDVVLGIFGQIRPYKNLASCLVTIREALSANANLRLLIAGKISDPKVKAGLEQLPVGQVRKRDAFLSDKEFAELVAVSDIGFLSYRHILTSGSLFHLFSCSKPVIAPAIGTIPAYVVPSWNGYLYSSQKDLSLVLSRVARMERGEIASMGRNAERTARRLSWHYPGKPMRPSRAQKIELSRLSGHMRVVSGVA